MNTKRNAQNSWTPTLFSGNQLRLFPVNLVSFPQLTRDKEREALQSCANMTIFGTFLVAPSGSWNRSNASRPPPAAARRPLICSHLTTSPYTHTLVEQLSRHSYSASWPFLPTPICPSFITISIDSGLALSPPPHERDRCSSSLHGWLTFNPPPPPQCGHKHE